MTRAPLRRAVLRLACAATVLGTVDRKSVV